MKKILTLWFMVALVVISAHAVGDTNMNSKSIDSPDDSIQIIIDGDPGAEFSASFKISHDGEVVTHELMEKVPQRFSYHGDAIEMVIRQTSGDGELSVEVRKSGNISRSRTRGGDGELRVKVQ